MFEEYQICPYTGLRSFTEEESLYFKGREEHIEQATEQLQRNKFLMLTGASGDGKSSLVYAGIVPNARAGFLKSKYTQWCVADFRPERAPFKNLCRAVARQLEIANPLTVESELRHGFSALVDLYLNSLRFADTDSSTWKNANENQRAALKRSAANLMIIVDQFEEFFTNPENYHRGVPSRDSNLVLNLLLETSRIALEQDLPIYIVFTMRSDYIGQCAAFRSLPEYIGFSQFFVPRLNRSQLQQVIEEPATLSGNKITRRLTERLIHDIAEGVDQLPILQHALNQIWHAANKGADEMDLLHYAMVGGVSAEELPDAQVTIFKDWFAQLPENVKACYHEPNLQNVLDTHANKLYESAAKSYNIRAGKKISADTAKTVIKKTFSCLTKIDESRAVRSRMTLIEIWRIINMPDVDLETLGYILDIFREPGNTFIRPFITEESGSVKLLEDDVLDITHESLIRNWKLLEQWAKEEFDSYTISLDFGRQLNHWVDSGKSGDFLLSMGPLTYFENWYNKANPNAYWIARYLPKDIDSEQKLAQAKVILSNGLDFFKKSARRHLLTRTVIRYGPRRIAAVMGVIAVLVLSSFAVRNYLERQNNVVFKKIDTEAVTVINDKKANYFTKAFLVANYLQSDRLTLKQILAEVPDTLTKLNIAGRLASILAFQGKDEPAKQIRESFEIADQLLSSYSLSGKKADQLTLLIKEVDNLKIAIGLAITYNSADELKKLRKNLAIHSAKIVMFILNDQPAGFKEINRLNSILENAINNKTLTAEELSLLMKTLSPFEGHHTDWVKSLYSKDKVADRSWFDYGFKFNGLYQELAYLYATQGNASMALRCVDSLLKYNQSYHQNDYTSMIDNAGNIAVVFYAYEKEKELNEFIAGYCERKKIKELEFYQRLIARNNIYWNTGASLFAEIIGRSYKINFNCAFADDAQIEFLFKKYRTIIENTTKGNEKNFLLALSYKDEALLRYNLFHLAQKQPSINFYEYFDKAFDLYRKIETSYLNEQINIHYGDFGGNSSFNKPVPRRFVFLYPDYRTVFIPNEPRLGHNYFTSEFFVKYILDEDLLSSVYSGKDLDFISEWLDGGYSNVFLNFNNGAVSIRRKAKFELLTNLESKVSSRKDEFANLYLLQLILGQDASSNQDDQKAAAYFKKIEIPKLVSRIRADNNEGMFAFTAIAITNLMSVDDFSAAYRFIKEFKNPINRSSLYSYAAIHLKESKVGEKWIVQLLDSARKEMGRAENLNQGQPNRWMLAHALTMHDPQRNLNEAYRVTKNIWNKGGTVILICQSFAFHNELFGAMENIPAGASVNDKCDILWHMMFGYNKGNKEAKPQWKEYEEHYFAFFTRGINYLNEN